METLNRTLRSIGPVDETVMDEARRRSDVLTKPSGSLGRLEEIAQQVAGITRQPRPRICQKAIFTLAGDHGVAGEGVSAYPQDVTGQMVLNFLRGGAAINVLARLAGARVVVADLGVAAPLEPDPALVPYRIGPGTRNMPRETAMRRPCAAPGTWASQTRRRPAPLPPS